MDNNVNNFKDNIDPNFQNVVQTKQQEHDNSMQTQNFVKQQVTGESKKKKGKKILIIACIVFSFIFLIVGIVSAIILNLITTKKSPSNIFISAFNSFTKENYEVNNRTESTVTNETDNSTFEITYENTQKIDNANQKSYIKYTSKNTKDNKTVTSESYYFNNKTYNKNEYGFFEEDREGKPYDSTYVILSNSIKEKNFKFEKKEKISEKDYNVYSIASSESVLKALKEEINSLQDNFYTIKETQLENIKIKIWIEIKTKKIDKIEINCEKLKMIIDYGLGKDTVLSFKNYDVKMTFSKWGENFSITPPSETEIIKLVEKNGTQFKQLNDDDLTIFFPKKFKMTKVENIDYAFLSPAFKGKNDAFFLKIQKNVISKPDQRFTDISMCKNVEKISLKDTVAETKAMKLVKNESLEGCYFEYFVSSKNTYYFEIWSYSPTNPKDLYYMYAILYADSTNIDDIRNVFNYFEIHK